MKVEWSDSIESNTAYDTTGKRIGCVLGSGDGHFRAFVIKIDVTQKTSIGDYCSKQAAKASIESYWHFFL